MSGRAWSGFLGLSVLWGIPYLFIKVAVDDGVPPIFLAWVRVALAAIVGLAVGFAGVVALVGIDVGSDDLIGAIAILFAAFGYACGPIIYQRFFSGLDVRAAVGATLLAATVFLTPFALADIPARLTRRRRDRPRCPRPAVHRGRLHAVRRVDHVDRRGADGDHHLPRAGGRPRLRRRLPRRVGRCRDPARPGPHPSPGRGCRPTVAYPSRVPSSSILLLGEGDLAEEVRAALAALDADVLRLKRPTQREVEEVFARGGIARAVVVSEDDAIALRIALMVRDADADVELMLTYFDATTASELCDRIGNCRITSLAEIVAPVLAASCLDEDLGAIRRDGDRLIGLRAAGGELHEVPIDVPHPQRLQAIASGVIKPYDRSAALLLYGAVGIVAILLLETVTATLVLEQNLVDSFYGAAKTLVTVDPNDKVSDGPKAYKIIVAVMMLVALVFEAFFTAGIVNRMIDRRLTGLFGATAVPRESHVLVIGLGQVGLRLAKLLRECGVAVVCIDEHEEGENVGSARESELPVVIGRGADPSVLRRLSLDRAQAVAAVTNNDLENLSIAMTVLSLRPDLRVVVRVGDGELANETRSLFKLGLTRDVHRIAAALIAAQATGSDAERVVCHDDRTHLLHPDGAVETAAISAAA